MLFITHTNCTSGPTVQPWQNQGHVARRNGRVMPAFKREKDVHDIDVLILLYMGI